MGNKIGFIGLGRMGRPMASNMQKKGIELVVLDLNKSAVAELVALLASDRCGYITGQNIRIDGGITRSV